jgi:hypothetical protein
VAASQAKIGAGIVYSPDDYVEIRKEEKEFLLISKPTKYLATWISSSCEREQELNTMTKFIAYMESVEK